MSRRHCFSTGKISQRHNAARHRTRLTNNDPSITSLPIHTQMSQRTTWTIHTRMERIARYAKGGPNLMQRRAIAAISSQDVRVYTSVSQYTFCRRNGMAMRQTNKQITQRKERKKIMTEIYVYIQMLRLHSRERSTNHSLCET